VAGDRSEAPLEPDGGRPSVSRDQRWPVGLAVVQRECAERAEVRAVGTVEVGRARGEQSSLCARVGTQQRLLTRERRVERFDAVQALGYEAIDGVEHRIGRPDVGGRAAVGLAQPFTAVLEQYTAALR
jgi:hypothetical protein